MLKSGLTRFLWLTVKILVGIIILIFALFFWAKSPIHSKNDYSKIIKHTSTKLKLQDSVLKVMTYNIGYLSGMKNNRPVEPSQEFYTNNLDDALKHIQKVSADIIAFQEIDYESKRSYFTDQHTAIANKLYPNSAKAVNWDKRYLPFPYWPPKVHFGRIYSGQSVMSMFPIVKNERIVLDKVDSHSFYFQNFYIDRLAQVTDILHSGDTIRIINVHAEAFDQPTRIEQLRYLRNLFHTLAKNNPVIMLGDFNSSPNYHNPAINMLLKDSQIQTANPDNGLFTFSSEKPFERIDYIFYSKHFEIIDCRTLYEFGAISDHLPVMAELKLK